MAEENLCVLIDFENIAAGTEKEGLGRFNIRMVMNRLKEKGRVLVARAYGDWGRFAKFKQSLLEQGITMMELTSYRGQEKNRADIALVVDAMELAFTRDYLSTYVLLSGDSDFTPLVTRLRELNKKVIGIGTRNSTSRLLADSCDEFIFYENLKSRMLAEDDEDDNNGDRPKRNLSISKAFALLIDTLSGMQKDQPGPVSAGVLKQSMLRKLPTFDEGEFGYSGFTRFLYAARAKKLVSLARDERAGGYVVNLTSEEDNPVSEDNQPLQDQYAELPSLEGQALEWQQLLRDEGFHPTTHMIRHTVVHELVEHVLERTARKKRNTLRYVYSDIQRRCRKTDPPIHPQLVREIINTLKASGSLIHPNGQPVRSDNAQFLIHQEAEELLHRLREFYISVIVHKNGAIQDTMALSELLWDDGQHQQEAEEMLAWFLREQSTSDESVEENEPTESTSSEQLTTPQPAAIEPAPTTTLPETKLSNPDSASKSSQEASVEESTPSTDAPQEESVSEPKPKKPRRKYTRRKPSSATKTSTKKPDAAKKDGNEQAEKTSSPDSSKPKRKTTRRRPKKAAAEAETKAEKPT